MFGKRKKTVRNDYPASEWKPAVKKSICTGEATFGFVSKADGRFVGLGLVRDAHDLKALMEEYGAEGMPEEIW